MADLADLTQEQLRRLRHDASMVSICALNLAADPDGVHVESLRNRLAMHARRIAEVVMPQDLRYAQGGG